MYIPSHNELYHYGVLGMKWGVRKDRDAKSAGRTAKVRDYQSIRTKTVVKTVHRQEGEIWSIPGGSESRESSVKNSNPRLQELMKDAGVESIYDFPITTQLDCAYSMNCGSCNIAYFARKRGLDVQAVPNWFLEKSTDTDDILNCYRTADGKRPEVHYSSEGKHISDRDAFNFQRFAGQDASFKSGMSGPFNVHWKGVGGHALTWENRDGQIYIVDPQIQEEYTWEDWLQENDWDVRSFEYYRTDDCELDMEYAKQWLLPQGDSKTMVVQEPRSDAELDRIQKGWDELQDRTAKSKTKMEKSRKNQHRERQSKNGVGKVKNFVNKTKDAIVKTGKSIADKFFKKSKKPKQEGGGVR